MRVDGRRGVARAVGAWAAAMGLVVLVSGPAWAAPGPTDPAIAGSLPSTGSSSNLVLVALVLVGAGGAALMGARMARPLRSERCRPSARSHSSSSPPDER